MGLESKNQNAIPEQQRHNLKPEIENQNPRPESQNENPKPESLKPESKCQNARPVANFILNEKVSIPATSRVTPAKPGYFCNNNNLSALRPFTVDSVKTFIDAESIIDYGSLATTQPIDVDEALGALDSLKFARADAKLADSRTAEISMEELKESIAKKEKEVQLWQTKNRFQRKDLVPTKNDGKVGRVENKSPVPEKPICPTILPKLNSNKASSVDIYYEFAQKSDDAVDGASQVEVEIVKGSDVSVNDTDDVMSGFDGEWGSGWTSPLTAGTSSDGNLDEEDGFKTGNSAADSEEEVTWKAEDKRFF